MRNHTQGCFSPYFQTIFPYITFVLKLVMFIRRKNHGSYVSWELYYHGTPASNINSSWSSATNQSAIRLTSSRHGRDRSRIMHCVFLRVGIQSSTVIDWSFRSSATYRHQALETYRVTTVHAYILFFKLDDLIHPASPMHTATRWRQVLQTGIGNLWFVAVLGSEPAVFWQDRSQNGLGLSWSYTFGLASNTVVPVALQRGGRII